MALLIAIELFSMLFTTGILSSVRAFVHGEGMWSKAQKDSMQSLYKYAYTGNRKFYLEFREHLNVNFGDRQARMELIKPNPDLAVVRDGFIKGHIHPDDIDGLVKLFQRFNQVSYIHRAIEIWTEADRLLEKLIQAAADLDKALTQRPTSVKEVRSALIRLDSINKELTILENEFSNVLGEGSRWLEGLLRYLLIIAVLIVESTGIYLTFSFSRHVSRSIKEISEVTNKVGQGDFSQSIPVRSNDELGRLASSLNRMTADLQNSIGLRRKAESENQTKSLFLANMSHEIRTPLGIILGLTEALKQQDTTVEEQTKFLDTIQRTGEDLKQIVNDILDISKVEAGYLEIERSQFSLHQFLDDLKLALDVRAEKNKNELIFKSSSTEDIQIFTDPIRLKQILVNILGNALKFTRNGRVSLTYWFEKQNLFFRVTDTGIGITEEQSKQLFQAFSQVDASTTRKYGGTGLGLFLSKHLASMLGGSISLESSNPGKGSSFLISISSPELTKNPGTRLQKSPEQIPADFKGKKVLIVDDSPDNQTLLQFFLKKWNIDFVSAENGLEGVEKASKEDFDLVLMDIQMPLMDGYEATRELRRRNFKKPIIALTAHAMTIDQERCLQSGCNQYLTKPVDFKQIYETLRGYLSENLEIV